MWAITPEQPAVNSRHGHSARASMSTSTRGGDRHGLHNVQRAFSSIRPSSASLLEMSQDVLASSRPESRVESIIDGSKIACTVSRPAAHRRDHLSLSHQKKKKKRGEVKKCARRSFSTETDRRLRGMRRQQYPRAQGQSLERQQIAAQIAAPAPVIMTLPPGITRSR